MNIVIKDIVHSDTAVSYEDGQQCLKKILTGIEKQEEIILDFIGIDYVITAFLNPVIGDLILQKGPDIMSKIKICHANSNILDKIKIVAKGALLKREDFEEE